MTNDMKPHYDFSGAVRGRHASAIRRQGYKTVVHHADGRIVETTFPPEGKEPEATRTAGLLFLRTTLSSFGVPIAEPWHDDHIDLIAYVNSEAPEFCPVVVATSASDIIHIRSEDELKSKLLLAFVWQAGSHLREELYAAPFRTVIDEFRKHGYLDTPSYQKGVYGTKPNSAILDFMRQHRITSAEQWLQQVRNAAQSY